MPVPVTFLPHLRADVLELALRSVAADHSESPMYLVLPAFRSSSSAGIDSSRGVSSRGRQHTEALQPQHRETYWSQSDGDITGPA